MTIVALRTTHARLRESATPFFDTKDTPFIASDKQKFILGNSKKPRKCGASWYNIIISELVI